MGKKREEEVRSKKERGRGKDWGFTWKIISDGTGIERS
jgi:hypothetical protein